MPELDIPYSLIDRFFRYVKIDTQSDPDSPTTPSTEKQKNLGRILVEELQEIGIADAEMDEWGYIYATIPSTSEKEVPVICLCAHMDTSPDSSGKDVVPIIHHNYEGQDLVLPDDPSQVLRVEDHPGLRDQMGHDVITASGTTLLGADNKAGVAEIMNVSEFLMANPQIKHGKIRILFTPDEEIGRGPDKADMERLGADFGYTVDGEAAGSLEDETFSADMVTISITGVSAHPGFAKGKLESAIKAAGELLAGLPKKRLSPESTEGKEGFVHPVTMNGSVEEARLVFIIRDFEESRLKDHEAELKSILDEVMKGYPKSSATFKVTEQYRNMKVVLDHHPQVLEYAEEAIRRAGLKVKRSSIRGGTDGSRFTFMGLPCPNIFAGEHAFHSKQEWVSVQDMQSAVHTLVHLCVVWEERS